MLDKITKTFATWIVCRTIENIVMIAGIIFAAIHFNRFSLLWFLLIPALNSVTTLKHTTGKDEQDG